MSDPTPPPTTTSPSPEVEPLQVALAAEHAAVFVLAALGAQTSRTAAPTLHARLTEAYLVHLARRDRLITMVTSAGAEPAAAEPGYELPADLGSTAAVTTRARALEEAAASTYAFVVASTTGTARTWAIEALVDAAVRVLGFGARPERLPGI